MLIAQIATTLWNWNAVATIILATLLYLPIGFFVAGIACRAIDGDNKPGQDREPVFFVLMLLLWWLVIAVWAIILLINFLTYAWENAVLPAGRPIYDFLQWGNRGFRRLRV